MRIAGESDPTKIQEEAIRPMEVIFANPHLD
jgi:hypothetical protein